MTTNITDEELATLQSLWAPKEGEILGRAFDELRSRRVNDKAAKRARPVDERIANQTKEINRLHARVRNQAGNLTQMEERLKLEIARSHRLGDICDEVIDQIEADDEIFYYLESHYGIVVR